MPIMPIMPIIGGQVQSFLLLFLRIQNKKSTLKKETKKGHAFMLHEGEKKSPLL